MCKVKHYDFDPSASSPQIRSERSEISKKLLETIHGDVRNNEGDLFTLGKFLRELIHILRLDVDDHGGFQGMGPDSDHGGSPGLHIGEEERSLTAPSIEPDVVRRIEGHDSLQTVDDGIAMEFLVKVF